MSQEEEIKTTETTPVKPTCCPILLMAAGMRRPIASMNPNEKIQAGTCLRDLCKMWNMALNDCGITIFPTQLAILTGTISAFISNAEKK